MRELHEREQFFWTPETVAHLAGVASSFERPCCLYAPMLGKELKARGVACRALDVDERFAHLRCFSRFDVLRPTWQGERFGAIFCDPPFWIVSLSQLFAAVRLLAQHDFAQPLAICYPVRRGANLCVTFARFGLAPTGFYPTYLTVNTQGEREKIEFYANFAWASELWTGEAPN